MQLDAALDRGRLCSTQLACYTIVLQQLVLKARVRLRKTFRQARRRSKVSTKMIACGLRLQESIAIAFARVAEGIAPHCVSRRRVDCECYDHMRGGVHSVGYANVSIANAMAVCVAVCNTVVMLDVVNSRHSRPRPLPSNMVPSHSCLWERVESSTSRCIITLCEM